MLFEDHKIDMIRLVRILSMIDDPNGEGVGLKQAKTIVEGIMQFEKIRNDLKEVFDYSYKDFNNEITLPEKICGLNEHISEPRTISLARLVIGVMNSNRRAEYLKELTW
jgi:hypothetical protein